MAASTDSATKAEEDVVFSTLPDHSKLASDQDGGSFASVCPSSPTVNETNCNENSMVCNAQSAVGSSPRLVQEVQSLDQELMHCSGVASNPGIPAELESNLTLAAPATSLSPMVDSVTNDMLKVSINQALGSTEDHLHLANGGSGHVKHHEMSMLIPANDSDEEDAAWKVAGIEPKPLSSNGLAVIAKADAPSLEMNNFMVGVNNSADGMLGNLSRDASELGRDDDNCEDDDDDQEEEGGEEEEVDDSGIDVDDEEEVDDSESEVEQDSDSSSSTSSLSFLLSSGDDDDDEVDSLHRLSNGANNPKDLVMVEESECEEGELKEPPSQRRKGGYKKKTVNENSEDEEGLKEPARSKNKEKDLPYVPNVFVTLEEYHKMVPVGFVSSVVGASLIVEGKEGQQPLNEGSILWLTDQRLPLGIIDELFGPVKKPFYVVRYNDVTEMPEGAKKGAQVSYVRDFADFVLNNPDLYSKGYDESGNEDNSDSEVHFSDDEKEAEYKRSKSRVKRANSESCTLEMDKRQHQEKRAEGKHLNRDNKNWRSRGENARAFQFNHEFSGRPPPRHQNAQFQHHRSEREPPSADRVEPMQTFNERNTHWRRNQSPVHRAQSQQSLGVGQSKPSTPVSSTSDGSVPSPSQVQSSNLAQLQRTSSPIVSEPILTNQLCSTSHQPIQMNQPLYNTSQQAQPLQLQSFPQPTSQQVQLLHMNQPCNLMQLTPQQIQTNEPHGLKQSTFPQVVPWQANQQQMPPSQPPGFQHSQMPVYGHAVVAGQVPQAAIGGCGIPLTNKPPLQPGTGTVQGLPPVHRSPIYQQQAPTLNQFSSSMPHPFSGQGSQVPPNMGMPMGNQIQAVPANGFPVGVQPAALAAPVLGIPAGSANTPFNYTMQMVCNQNFSGFTPAFSNLSPPSTYGVPEQARTMQPMAAASWQQHSPQDNSGLRPQQRPQQPFRQRPHQMRSPHQGRRF